jgi:hypothetical protein
MCAKCLALWEPQGGGDVSRGSLSIEIHGESRGKVRGARQEDLSFLKAPICSSSAYSSTKLWYSFLTRRMLLKSFNSIKIRYNPSIQSHLTPRICLPAMLCEKCSNIHFKPAEEYGLAPEDTSWKNSQMLCYFDREKQEILKKSNEYLKTLYYFHHESKEKLRQSAENGCHFCGMIWHSLFATNEFQNISGNFDDEGVVFTKLFERPWALEHLNFGPVEYVEPFDVQCEGRMTNSSFSRTFSGT